MQEKNKRSPQQIIFDEEGKRLVENGLFKDPHELLDWAEEVTRKTIKIDNSLNGNHTAFEFQNIIKLLENSNDVFQSVIDYGKSINIVSDVQANDIGYQAVVVMSMYLDQIGLGYTDNPPKLLKV